MDLRLTGTEARVLGALIEKEITTPDYYPLSLNALVNASNQKNNRDPVMSLTEEDVRAALSGLQDQRLAGPARGADSRVSKYEHRIQEVFNFTRPETAILCVLLLRGPQTPGELRGRAERMFQFEHLDDVQSTLHRDQQLDFIGVRDCELTGAAEELSAALGFHVTPAGASGLAGLMRGEYRDSPGNVVVVTGRSEF